MTGIFPQDFDGGLPANPDSPTYPAQAFLHRHRLPVDTSALYYGNGCDVRLRPHVLNSLISEVASIADRAGVGYRASSLQNAERSIRYLIQRGLPHASMLVQFNPWHFEFTLDPPPICYTDFMTCLFVPRMPPDTDQNQGFVRINMNGLGYCPLYRHDGSECKTGDLLPLKPFLAAYFNGAWYILTRIPPLFKVGEIDLWVRTDGNDETGDGTRNRADKAFRTINGAFRSVGERFMATPLFVAHIKLGIPGDYESAALGPFGSSLYISGGGYDGGGWGGGSRFDYRIFPRFYAGEEKFMCLSCAYCNYVIIAGVTFVINQAGPGFRGLLAGEASVGLQDCGFECYASHAGNGWFIEIRSGLVNPRAVPGQAIVFNGNGNTISGVVLAYRSMYATMGAGFTEVSQGFHMAGAYFNANHLSHVSWAGGGVNATAGVTGMQFEASTNSILTTSLSNPIPGTVPGVAASGAQVVTV